MLKNIAPKPRTGTVAQSRRLRRDMSLPEILLWQALRRNSEGLKFRRQHPTGPYSLDFFCSDARLAVEVDGWAHDCGDRPARDAARDLWPGDRGIETLRIPAAEVLKDLDSVVLGLLTEATARLPLHHAASRHGPPPPDKLGEELGTLSNSSSSLLGEGDHAQHGGGAPSTDSLTPPRACLGEVAARRADGGASTQ